MTDEQLLVDTSDLVHIDNTETINGLKYFSHDTVVANASQMITNCITEIPQDIKLELNDGILTLKAGSKVYNSSGVWKVMSYDSSFSWGYSGSGFVFVQSNGGLAVTNTGSESVSTLPTPATTYKIFYNTTDGKCYFDSNNSQMEEISFPIATFTADNGIKSIDQVFNGFGYIGSTVFVLPGVKGLIPNGKNEDGSLKSVEFETSNVLTCTDTNTLKTTHWFICNGNYLELWDTVDWIGYNEKENTIYNKQTGAKISYCVCGTLNYEGTNKITSFTPKTPFHALDYNDKSTVSGWSMPSNKYITLTLGASGATYTAPANGYFTLFGHVNSAEIYNTSGSNLYWGVNGPTSTFKGVSCLAKKGDIVKIYYTTYGDNVIFRFIYAEGEI